MRSARGNIIALALLLAFLWGGNSLAIKIGLQDFPPMALAFLRFVIGLIVIGGWALYRRIPLLLRRGELPRLLLLTSDFHTSNYLFEHWHPIHIRLSFDHFH